MLRNEVGARGRERVGLSVHLARSDAEVREAQKLRWRIFADEMGARLDTRETGVDIDAFDPWCEHLIVREHDNGEVIGTYRILPGTQARTLGGFYSDNEFDLTRIDHLRDRTVEVGRSCVHPDHRNGATIALLWQGLAQFMQAHHYEFMIGCASVSMADGGHGAVSIYNRLRQSSLSPIEYRVFPRHPLPLDRIEGAEDAAIPPLIKGYVRCGAYVCGDPAWDPDFNTADLLMLLPMSRLDRRYARHFMKHDH